MHNDAWVTMTPPLHHVTMLSPVQMHVGELPTVTGKVVIVIYAGNRSEENAAISFGEDSVHGTPILIERAGPLHVLFSPTKSTNRMWGHHLRWGCDGGEGEGGSLNK